MDAEHRRLEETRSKAAPWKKWGPYLCERQWGTVREDYSESGDAWNYFSHDQARSRAYRWGEDGLAGISDDQQRLCFALALWNGKDPILKERLFGLTNSEGNHGEDVKEYYFYLDSTPTHSYMKYLYKYPQAAYPYDDLVETNRRRGRQEFEYELLDTGVFDQDRYFDVFVEYAKASPEDILIQITVVQPRSGAGDAARAADALVPQRLVVGWRRAPAGAPAGRRRGRRRDRGLASGPRASGSSTAKARPRCSSPRTRPTPSASSASPNRTPYVKDGINDYVVHGRQDAVNPEKTGTKAAAHYPLTVGGRGIADRSAAALRRGAGRLGADEAGPVRQRLRRRDGGAPAGGGRVLRLGHPVVAGRRRGQRDAPGAGRHALVQAVLLLRRRPWLEERGADPFKPKRRAARATTTGTTCTTPTIISMPDKWEYPWYAAWDLAFHVLALTLVDEDFGKQQLDLMLREQYLHPSGQLPGVRVELRRRQPAGARLVHDLHVPPGEGSGAARATSTGSSAPSTSCC